MTRWHIAAIAVVLTAILALMASYELQLSRLTGDISQTNRHLAAVQTSLGATSGSLGSLGSLDQLPSVRHGLAAMLPQLLIINRQLTAVRGNTGDIASLPALRTELGRLDGEVKGLVGQIGGMNAQLGGMRTQLGALPPMAGDVGTMAAQTQELTAELQQLIGVIDQVEGHVASLDRKTGPGVP